MSRNKIFIITGAIVSVILVALLILMQFIEGNAESIENSYTIEIQNCPAVSKNDNELIVELKAALQPTELKDKKGAFMSPLLKVNNLQAFGPPIYGMNFIRSGFDKSMYVLDDRKSDLNSFFESNAKSNKAFQEIMKEAKKDSKNEIKVSFDFKNDTTEFIIAKGQADKKKTFNSLQELRTHLDDLINKGKIEKGMTVKVYFICGDLSSLIDTDEDGLMDKDDKCPKNSGKKENNGCPDKDKDGIHDGEDQCPDKAGDKDCFGCKCPPPPPCPGDADDDRDGVCNRQDKCPNQFGNCKGCPDNDCDGILNDMDKCPNEAGELKCNGCPCPPPPCPGDSDDDGDGVCNKADKCPNEAGKTPDGCPMKVSVIHNSKTGVFSIIGVNNYNEIKTEIEIEEKSGKKFLRNFDASLNYPTKKEADNLLLVLKNPTHLNLTFKISDNKGNLLFKKRFEKLTLVCTIYETCGFKDTSKN
jgi:hypothetical protein